MLVPPERGLQVLVLVPPERGLQVLVLVPPGQGLQVPVSVRESAPPVSARVRGPALE